MTAVASYRQAGRDGFAELLHAEWTKFRTVRGWVIGVIVAVVAGAGLGLVSAGGSSSSCQQGGSSGPPRSGASCMPAPTLGPNGEPVSDSFYFVHQPLGASGTITVRVASMAGLEPWAKAGIIIKASASPGSAYAAMMVAAGHGVRMQWNYTGDTPGLPGSVGPDDPQWLRLTRAGDVITGYDSADGTRWTEVGAVTLPGLPSVALAGLMVASPDDEQETQSFGGGINGTSNPTQATAVFDHLSGLGGTWTGQVMGGDDAAGTGRYQQAGGQFTVTGSGDIAPVVAGHGGRAHSAMTVTGYLLGTFAGLIALVVVAVMFMTSEYRRSLIRVTLAVSPRRGRALAAKAVVAAAVSFVAGLAAAAAAVAAGTAIAHARGYYEFPVPGSVEARVIIGTGLLAAATAVLALAVATMVRRSAAAVAIVIAAMVLPYFFAVAAVVPLGAAEWLLRITPAAGFAIQQPYPQYAQVTALYSAVSGYFPLAPWAGLAVLCGWTAAALAGATWLLRLAGRLMQACLHAEWTKLRTVSSSWWLLLAAVTVTVAVGAAVTAAVQCGPGGCLPGPGGPDPAKVSLTGVEVAQVIVALVAVITVGGEYGTGMIRVTLAATPRRLVMMGAKALVVAGWTAAAGAVAVLGSVLAGRLILPGRGLSAANGYPPVSLGNGPDLRAAAGSVLYLALIALLALGVATAVRDSAVGIGLVLGLLYLFPIVSSVIPDHVLARHLEQIAPMTAGLYVQVTVGVRDLPLTPWQGLGVLAAWAAGALLAGGALLRLRDA